MIRKAKLSDVKDIYKLIEIFANKGEMLHRPLNDIYENLRDFYVYEENAVVLGACALHISWEDIGEIRSLAVSEEAGGKGVGTVLVNACLDEAKSLGIPKIFALTYKPGECVKCFKFPDCDENAMVIEVTAS
ncbi:MAG: GNAT family N-acetyltransferase [Deltaproteobacteria bacterium]|nr:GNAT family N-acetyltransferase [Deltaproteobacteria bacterium]